MAKKYIWNLQKTVCVKISQVKCFYIREATPGHRVFAETAQVDYPVFQGTQEECRQFVENTIKED